MGTFCALGYEAGKEKEVMGATAKLVWGCMVLASKAPQNEFGAGTSGLVLAPFAGRRAVAVRNLKCSNGFLIEVTERRAQKTRGDSNPWIPARPWSTQFTLKRVNKGYLAAMMCIMQAHHHQCFSHISEVAPGPFRYIAP